jgi:hypothetical protein
MRYAHLMPEHLSGSMAALAEAMRGDMDPQEPTDAVDTQVDNGTVSADHAEAADSQSTVSQAVI